MRVLRRGNRLSITPVTDEEWRGVLHGYSQPVTLGLGWQLRRRTADARRLRRVPGGLARHRRRHADGAVHDLRADEQGHAGAYVVKMAIATSLATICFTSLSSVRAHHRRGAVRWDVVVLLAPGIVAGSLIGAQLARRCRRDAGAAVRGRSSASRRPRC